MTLFRKAHGYQICQIRLIRSTNQVQTNLKVIDDAITEKSRDFVKTFSLSFSKGCGYHISTEVYPYLKDNDNANIASIIPKLGQLNW